MYIDEVLLEKFILQGNLRMVLGKFWSFVIEVVVFGIFRVVCGWNFGFLRYLERSKLGCFLFEFLVVFGVSYVRFEVLLLDFLSCI